ncbi:COP9 signalosome complex subunit 1 [Aspergillus fijiensis CBS 313.89]|uniref:COP9 signalosome complex subunit 1 n=1 Tax=Aspergillus fijiensis CBS 313.89 TaxID=1448319 RepID=A0A8G1VXQ0_9EURO|nr:COP9 signalosome subunit 1 [Aspergillus fijiensis CBS 313.89]RAK76442.1 COP9 signalosome subunit 1 [Aspergillus fijiensis CBS 313.89]
MDYLPTDGHIEPSAAYTGQGPGGGNVDLDSISGASLGLKIRVEDPPKFELESYIANYTGRTRYNRLYVIGTCSTYLAVEALKAAIAEAKSGKDVTRYERAVRALAEVAPNDPEATLDTHWVDHMQKVVKAETDRLEHELKGYKNNLIKESIRMGNEDLGQHYYLIGDLTSASKAYSRMRDYCTTPTHIISMLFKIINVAIERGDWLSVQSNVHRLRNLQSKQDEQSKVQPKLSTALGLSQLHSGSYLDAANSFLNTDPGLGDSYTEVLTSNDVAVYGGLCALASMDRHELQQRVLDNNSFRNFLELEPQIRRAIAFFCNSKFRSCLEILEAYRADYLLDIHLQRHVHTLFTRIRTKSIQQYLIPFNRVTLDSMSKMFAPGTLTGTASGGGSSSGGQQQSDADMDLSHPFVQELVTLIQDGTLDARIDLEKKVLVANQVDLRTELQETVLNDLEDYLQEAHIRLLRTNIIRAGLEVRADDKPREMRGKRSDGFGSATLSRGAGLFQ